jgi:hypothetical protein
MDDIGVAITGTGFMGLADIKKKLNNNTFAN